MSSPIKSSFSVPVQITFPIPETVPTGAGLMVVSYDPDTDEIRHIPVMGTNQDRTQAVYLTSHFSEHNPVWFEGGSLEGASVWTAFQREDGFAFLNPQSWCYGYTYYARWFFEHQEPSSEPLSSYHSAINSAVEVLIYETFDLQSNALETLLSVAQRLTFQTDSSLRCAIEEMERTGLPQAVGIYTTIWGSEANHSVLIVGYEYPTLYIYDPNYDSLRQMVFDGSVFYYYTGYEYDVAIFDEAQRDHDAEMEEITRQTTCLDYDGDYYGEGPYCQGPDCDDHRFDVNPGAEEVCDDGVDNDCQGGDAPCLCDDADGDGYGVGTGCFGPDCDDGDPSIYSGCIYNCDGVTPPAGYVCIPGGTFTMGSPADEPGRISDEGPQHEVTITRAFLMKETEVTQGEWQATFGNNPSYFSACGAECPVEQVTWWEAAAYGNALSVAEGLEECYVLIGCSPEPGNGMDCTNVGFVGLDCEGYRLPTEAEWEYAARAGTTTAFYTGALEYTGCTPLDMTLNPDLLTYPT